MQFLHFQDPFRGIEVIMVYFTPFSGDKTSYVAPLPDNFILYHSLHVLGDRFRLAIQTECRQFMSAISLRFDGAIKRLVRFFYSYMQSPYR